MDNRLDLLIKEFGAKFFALEEEFRTRATAIAWEIAASAISGLRVGSAIALEVAGMPVNEPENLRPARPRPKVAPIPVVEPVHKDPREETKAERFRSLIGTGKGIWISRGSTTRYRDASWKKDDPDVLILEREDSGVTIEVKFSTLLSRWNHFT